MICVKLSRFSVGTKIYTVILMAAPSNVCIEHVETDLVQCFTGKCESHMTESVGKLIQCIPFDCKYCKMLANGQFPL